MATIKKPAAKKPAAKKPAAKKPAAKKPAAKKPAAKKPAAKKPAAKKPVAKKAAVKKPAAKKPAAKKPVAKKPAAKKPVAKKAAVVKKPAAAAKPAALAKPVVKKPAEKPAIADNVKFRNLFEAYANGKLPLAQGYIVSSFFSETTAYSIYEIVSYAGVKEIYPTENGLQFVAGGKKLHVLLENATYPKKFIEPVSRDKSESIPNRFSELEIITASNQTKIMVAKEPMELTGSFTILKPNSINFSVVFYELPDLYDNVIEFFVDSFNKQRRIPTPDAKAGAKLVSATLEKKMNFKGEYS